ncbi:tetratricopeptide repeat-containing sensor histidine kinase [Galbibacter pacificus]|uniref:histidine kinase n=1 Tax=Galbibacter pacificus TaxID=2996052 RepID=A0ABT6FQ00_9FLAO|nr:histidine kinase dimerization/phosphoacceptor domain -containing protein [Galbibacter pacificus]MDG3582190.1 histidine kinase dimerization/phosphoacceptor domain -containing protein [Galbibacter pacificus]MDG3585334.1 histidine kinase [Galbibacter pacificus]
MGLKLEIALQRYTTYKKTVFLFLLLNAVVICYAQKGDTVNNDPLKEFLKINSIEERFNYFFNTNNRYQISSAYTWLDSINKPLIEAEKYKDSVTVFKYKTILAQLYYDVGNYDKGALIAELLYQKEGKLGREVKIQLLKTLDKLYEELQLYDKQLEIRRDLKNAGVAIVLYDVYAELGLYRQAMMEYVIANKTKLETSNDEFYKAKYYNDLGVYLLKDGSIYTALKDIETAKKSIDNYLKDTSISVDRFNEAVFLKGKIESNLGKCKMFQSKFKDALPYLEAGVSASKIHDNGMYSKTTVDLWGNIAECYLEINNLELAKAYLDSIVQQQKVVKSNSVNYNRLRANFYLKDSSPDSASLFFKKYVKLKDSVDYSSRKKQLLSLLVQFDLKNQKETIERQRLNLEKNKAEILEREKAIYLSVSALALCILCVIGLIVAYLKSTKNKRLIENQKRIIENSLIEKDSLLKEIHHRVKNNLQVVSSLLSIQTKNTKSKSAINALEEGKSRVKAMALIHQKLYQNEDLSVIKMQEYIESLSASIQSVYKKNGDKIHIHINAESSELDVDRAIPIGLILNELISNSFKYAFEHGNKGNIYISLIKEEDNRILFEYKDDGMGLPEGFDTEVSGSMGMNLIRRLANQLRSKINIDKNLQGVRFWFYFD